MTEEKKQALIEWLKPQIDELQNVSDEIPFGLDSDSAMHLNTMRVALAALTAQPIGRVDRGAATDSNEYPDSRVVCLHEHVGWEAFQDGCELFTRPAPAADLSGLVPDKWYFQLTFDIPNLENMTPYQAHGAAWEQCRTAILLKIEETK